MAHPRETREALRRAYIFSNQALELLAAQQGVSFSTAMRWKKLSADEGDSWDTLRAANQLASGAPEDVSRAILAGLMVQVQTTLEKLNGAEDIQAQERVQLLSSLSDAYTKAIAASKKVLPETDRVATAISTVKALSQFIQSHYPQHLAAFVEIIEAFTPELEKTHAR
ncbi:DNA-binding protein [Erwinia typographi]|uniref:DNA-binding protein n=1 Tax=Erwinia typographi TaxID=371042 RepID=A0A0A4ABW7_9GAMM|nr:DUF1804 family protein [Erwinia typographi]KGT95313.1 DNA-binding protein [Erwinia typographi]